MSVLGTATYGLAEWSGLDMCRVQPAQLYGEAPAGYNSGLFFTPKLLSSFLYSRSNVDQISLTDEAEDKLGLCEDVMNVCVGGKVK